jgi:hypothetical protein
VDPQGDDAGHGTVGEPVLVRVTGVPFEVWIWSAIRTCRWALLRDKYVVVVGD